MSSLPYISSPGNIDKALNAIKAEAVPDRVSQDFVKTILKIPGGSGDQMTTFLKKLNLANSDGTPNENYRKFRNPTSSNAAIAKCIKHAYAPLYVRNEYMHKLDDAALLGLVVEETGQAHDSNPVKLVVRCIQHLKPFANFEAPMVEETKGVKVRSESIDEKPKKDTVKAALNESSTIGLNLGYTINLNLPATSDPAVFDAIFRSLKENLLSQDDA